MKNTKFWGNSFPLFVSVILILGLITVGSTLGAPTKEKIKIGFSRSLSGSFAEPAKQEQATVVLWSEQVNQRGGLFIKDIGKKLPVELVFYDDKSSPEEAIKSYERLITQDKVDLLLPPTTTPMNMPLIPTVEKYKCPLVAATVASKKILELKVSYWFSLSPLEHMTSLTELIGAYKNQISTVAQIYSSASAAVENNRLLKPMLEKQGFKIVLYRDFPENASDLTELLLQIKRLNPDALVALVETPDSMLIMKQAQEVNLSPKILYLYIGPGTAPFYKNVGKAGEGIMGMGIWSPESPNPGSKEFVESYFKRWNLPPGSSSAPLGWQAVQVLEQAVDMAGTLDWKKLRDAIATGEFKTIIGPVKFAGPLNKSAAGAVLQWQLGKSHIVWPKDRKSADLMIPKPPWPK